MTRVRPVTAVAEDELSHLESSVVVIVVLLLRPLDAVSAAVFPSKLSSMPSLLRLCPSHDWHLSASGRGESSGVVPRIPKLEIREEGRSRSAGMLMGLSRLGSYYRGIRHCDAVNQSFFPS